MERESSISRHLCSILILESFLLTSTWTKEDCSPCSSPLHNLYQIITEDLFPDGYEVYINCLAFDEYGDLSRGIASGYSKSGTNQTMRMIVECQKKVLSAKKSGVAPNTSDIRNQGYTACLECADTMDACRTPCDRSCEKCFSNSKTCTACTRYRLLNSYLESDDIGPHDPASMKAQCLTERPVLSHKYSTDFQCVHDCPDNGNHLAPNEIQKNTCFACGLEYCVQCEPNSTATEHERSEGGGRAMCTSCLVDTVLHKGRCYACPLADIARVAIKQEEEKKAETASRRKKHTTLAIVLVVVLSCIVALFIQVSIYAHFVYKKTSPCGTHQKDKKKHHTILHRIQ